MREASVRLLTPVKQTENADAGARWRYGMSAGATAGMRK
jgi:hypothetical protein